MVYQIVVHLRAKDEASTEKLKDKLIEAAQVYSRDKETLSWYISQSTSDPQSFTIIERYQAESSQTYHLDNPYWKTFDKYVGPLLDGQMDLRRLNEIDTSGMQVKVETDGSLWDAISKHQRRRSVQGNY